MIGKVVGNYRIVRELGTGAMGAVYEGVDVMVERPVAIKMLRAEIARQPDLIERFRVEAVTLAKLNHPSIATLYSFFRDSDDYYMVMEFVRGRTLEDIIRQSGRLAPGPAADILGQTLDGLAHAHRMGILHRDIKPANIMINDEGRVKVTDFGIARVLGSARMTREGRIIGTLEYIAPERIRGEETDARSDLYSAGVVLFEALAGRLPFTADTDYALMQAHVKEPPPPMVALGVNCPASVEAVLTHALAKSPQERFQSAEEFRDALMASRPLAGTRTASVPAAPALKPTRLAGTPVVTPHTPPPAPPVPPVPPSRRLPPKVLAACGAGLAVVLVAAVGIFLYLRPKPPAQTAAVTPPLSLQQTPAPYQQPVAPIQQSLPPQGQGVLPVPPGQLPPPAEPAPGKPAAPVQMPRKQTTAGNTIANPPASKPGGSRTPEPAPAPAAPVAQPPSTPSAAPSTPAPAAAPRPAPRSIRDVHKLYIEKMPADLKEYVSEEIARQMHGRLAVVPRKEDADAIMTGREETADDLGSKVTGGYLGMKDKANATATVTDVNRSTMLWSSQAGDKTPFIGVLRRGGMKKVAERLVSSLKKAMQD